MKKILTALVIGGFLFSNANAQFNQVWNQNYQHTSTVSYYSNEGRKVAEDASGNIFTLSDVTSDLDPTGVVTGSTYHYSVVRKYSTTGGLLAQKVIQVFNHQTAGFENPGAFGLEVDAGGNVYIGFCPWDTGWGTNYNVEVMKCNNSLSLVWECLYVTNGNDHGVEMKIASSGEVYAIVSSINGGTTIYSLLDFAGQGAPTLIYSFSSTEVISSMALNPASEDVYVTGYVTLSGVKNILMAGINSITHVVKWTYNKNVGAAGQDDFGTAITIGADGNIYAVGTGDSPNGNSVIILKHSPRAGKISWISSMHHSSSDHPRFILAPEPNFAYVGVASDQSISLYKFSTLSQPGSLVPYIYRPTPVEPNSTVLSTTLNGMKVSSNQKIYITGGVSAEDGNGYLFNAKYLAKFNVVFGTTISLAYAVPVAGDMNESFEGVSLSLDAAKTDIYWLVNSWDDCYSHKNEFVRLYDMDVTLPLRRSMDEVSSLQVSVFPVPATDKLTITASEPITSIEISDLTGQKIKSISNFSGTTVDINLAGLSPGLYFCKTIGGTGTVNIKRFLIQ